MFERHIAVIAVGSLLCLSLATPSAVYSASPRASWDDMVKVQSQPSSAAYLLPGANFNLYNKVLLDPAKVSLSQSWLKDINSGSRSRRLTEADAKKIAEAARRRFDDILRKAFIAAGWQVVTGPGPDVLRIRPGVVDLYINAPNAMTQAAGRAPVYSPEAGGATLFIEARDSITGALLGRALDRRIAGDNPSSLMGRSGLGNRADFSALFKAWAKACTSGLATLEAAAAVGGAPHDGWRMASTLSGGASAN